LKFAKAVAHWVFIICFSVLLITSTVRLGVNSVHLYEYGFDRYRVSEDTGIDRDQLSEVAKRLADYFNSRVETPQMMVATEGGEEFALYQEDDQNRELTHLADVRKLFQLNYRIQVVSLAYIIIYVLLFLLWVKGRWQELARGVRRGCAFTLAVIVMLGIASVSIDFEQLFIRFHHIAFDNPWWMSSGYLPRLFPGQFWQDIAFLGAGIVAAEALILGSIAWAVPFIRQKHKDINRAPDSS
jgi:integral membrane protein (TIGR01906 family)